MSKKLADMSLEELWQLFPIVLSEHKPFWSDFYNEEVQTLKKILPFDIEYYHIGSTAINGIMAKPIIDIILAVNSGVELEQVSSVLREHGYILMSSSANRRSLNKGYTENGFAEKVFHLHIRLKNDIDEVYFRDYMNADPAAAQEYEKLKKELWKKYEHDRDAYTEAKTDFVNKYTSIAKKNLGL